MPDRAVIWCAVSDPSQAKEGKESLPAQERDGLVACQKIGATVISVLKVPGFSRSYLRIEECAEDMAAKGIMAMRDLDNMIRAKNFDCLVVRRGDRFGRSQSLFTIIVESIVAEMGGRLFETSRQRWVDKSNFRDYIATEGYRAASEIDNNVERARMGMIGRIHRGLPMTDIPASHRLIRDPQTGKAARLEVREELRQLWDDAAALLMSRPEISWKRIESELWLRHRHVNPDTGRRWSEGFFYSLLYNPLVWGAAAHGYLKKNDVWAFDETEPLPQGVTIDRQPNPPIPPLYTGDLAEDLKVELRYRTKKRGRTPHKSYKFSGLLVCGSCGRTMSVATHAGITWVGWRCLDKYKLEGRGCTNFQNILDPLVQEQVDLYLERWLDSASPASLPMSRSDPQLVATQRIDQLIKELAALERRVDRLIGLQTEAEENLRGNYTQKLSQESERKQVLLAELGSLQATQESASLVAARISAHQELKTLGLEAFWKKHPSEIKRTLLQIVGKSRFVVLGSEIVDLR